MYCHLLGYVIHKWLHLKTEKLLRYVTETFIKVLLQTLLCTLVFQMISEKLSWPGESGARNVMLNLTDLYLRSLLKMYTSLQLMSVQIGTTKRVLL